jgi:hypothetical protein
MKSFLDNSVEICFLGYPSGIHSSSTTHPTPVSTLLGADPSVTTIPSTNKVGGSDLAGRALYPTYQCKNITSDDLIADLDRISDKLVDCVQISEAILPPRKPSGFPMGLRNAGHTYQQQLLKAFQTKSRPAFVKTRSWDCGEWQTPRKTL